MHSNFGIIIEQLIQLPNYSAVKRLVTADELAVMRENVITRAISYRIYRCEMG